MGAHSFKDLLTHVGHKIECVVYGLHWAEGDPPIRIPDNVSIECVDCNEVLLDFNNSRQTTAEERDFNQGYCEAEAEMREMKKQYGLED